MTDERPTDWSPLKMMSDWSSVMPRSWRLARVVMSAQPSLPNGAMASPRNRSCSEVTSPLGNCKQGLIKELAQGSFDAASRRWDFTLLRNHKRACSQSCF